MIWILTPLEEYWEMTAKHCHNGSCKFGNEMAIIGDVSMPDCHD